MATERIDLDAVVEKAMKVVELNETSGREDVIYGFSDADGPGRSGWSFGRSQFDTRWYPRDKVTEILRRVGLTDREIASLIEGTATAEDVKKMSRVFLDWKARAAVDEADRDHVRKAVLHVASLSGVTYHDEPAVVMAVDTHNQFYISTNGMTHRWMRTLPCVSAEDILEFKLKRYKWGRERPDDVWRRYDTVVRVTRGIERPGG